MDIAALTFGVLLALSPTSDPSLTQFGESTLPPERVAAILHAAVAENIEIVAVEDLKGDILKLTLAYGPPTKQQSGVCRGILYAVDSSVDKNGSTQWQIIRFGIAPPPAPQMSYVVPSGPCRSPLRSRVIIGGKFADVDLLQVLDAVDKRRIAGDPSGERPPLRIDKEWSVAMLESAGDGERATAEMVDPARPGESLTVLLMKIAGTWVIADAGQGLTWGR